MMLLNLVKIRRHERFSMEKTMRLLHMPPPLDTHDRAS